MGRGSLLYQGSENGSHIRNEKDGKVTVRLQYVEAESVNQSVNRENNPFNKVDRTYNSENDEAPPILEVGETVELKPANVSASADEADNSKDESDLASVNTIEEFEQQEQENEKESENVSPAAIAAQKEIEAAQAAEKTSKVAVIDDEDMLEVEKYKQEEIQASEENPEPDTDKKEEAAGIVGALVTGMKDIATGIFSKTEEHEVEAEELGNNTKEVVLNLGLRPRTGSFETEMIQKANGAEKERLKAIEIMEKSTRVVDVIMLQDKMLEEQEAMAKEMGDQEQAKQIAEKRETAHLYAEEQEQLSAKASMMRMEAEAV